MNPVELRAATESDADAVWRVVAAQDTAWWGVPDGDADDAAHLVAMAVAATGSLEAGVCVAVTDGLIVGVAMLIGHGQTNLAVDPAAADDVGPKLVAWLVERGATRLDAPAQDEELIETFVDAGFVPMRSSFEMERPGDTSDLDPAIWPDGIVPVPFRAGVDEEEVHEMIYSFWTDVPGHTYRPIDEWRSVILGGPRFDPELIVLTRTEGGSGPAVGIALGGIHSQDVGWVTQLGVSRSARGLGLGRAILVEACHRLSRTDPRIIGLGVEADNANALDLYRSVGMGIDREWMHYGPA